MIALAAILMTIASLGAFGPHVEQKLDKQETLDPEQADVS